MIAAIESQYGDSISTSGKSALRATGNALGGKLKLLYLTLANAQKNMLPDIADSVQVGGTLERWGFIKLGRYPFQATSGQYVLLVTGNPGTTINGQTTFLSDDNSLNPGQLYILDSPYTLTTSQDYITVRALTPGTTGSLDNGNTLTATSPIPNIDSSVTVDGEFVQPLDAESLEEYRKEVSLSFKRQPRGGAPTDYRLWAQDVQGVANVYPYAAPGKANQGNIYIESNVSDSIDGKGTPSADMIANVEAVINFSPDETLPVNQRGRKPMTVIVNYLPVTIITVDITVPSFVGTFDIKSIINNAVTAYISSIRPFVAGADILADKNDMIDQNNITSVILAAVPGASFGAPILKINGVVMPSYQFEWGNIPFNNPILFS